MFVRGSLCTVKEEMVINGKPWAGVGKLWRNIKQILEVQMPLDSHSRSKSALKIYSCRSTGLSVLPLIFFYLVYYMSR